MAVGLLAGAGVFGALIGSFLNVVILRTPTGKSIVSPPSACANCGARIRPWDNVPVVSWLVLRGRCRDCGNRISARYPLVELGTGIFFALVGWWALDGGASATGEWGIALALVAFLYLAAVSVALTMIDLDTHKLPNKIVLPSYIVGGVLLGSASLLAADYEALIRAGIGMAGMFAAYFLMALAYRGGMGFGDVKLAGVLGLFLAWLGLGQLLVGAFAAFVLGGVFSIILLVLSRAGRKSGIPFGPWMLGGAWVGIFLGDSIWTGYLALFGLG
ncbi:MAG: prepilin peptidase [Homoserinimonas sp.]